MLSTAGAMYTCNIRHYRRTIKACAAAHKDAGSELEVGATTVNTAIIAVFILFYLESEHYARTQDKIMGPIVTGFCAIGKR